MKIKFALLVMLALAGCESYRPEYYSRAVFWPDQVAWAAKPGANSVTGSAMFQVPGKLVPCDYIAVRLVPDSPYARQRFNELYGSDVAGSNSGTAFNEWGPERGDYRWLESGKSTTCGPNGTFAFEGAADGTWYVVSTWVDSTDPKARSFSTFKRVDLRGGQQAQVLLP